MRRLAAFLAASALLGAPVAHANTDAEVIDRLGELVGSIYVLQELADGWCSDYTRAEPMNPEALFSWAMTLASPLERARAEGRKAAILAGAKARAVQWVATEYRSLPPDGLLKRSCVANAGIFRTIRDAAEVELEDMEQQQRGSITPRAQR
ncbi:hypothetical protein [Ramlibacter albus]|uniref:TIGR02301 family protein n=1 Tax=Ramlibacter albus TaxID=2079448 RepID=A0A923S394_9BURK|nr:hypothetical protein [Ramlibacter albus]MBC5766309.1 hypothetical protein [Ramlibacter albus]